MKNLIKVFSNINIVIGFVLLMLPIGYLVIVAPLQPNIVASTMTPQQETTILTNKLSDSGLLNEPKAESTKIVAKNIIKTDKQYVRIPSIGVDTQVYEGADSSTLEKGVWIMPGHGTPEDNTQPTVLAAHRWGPDNASYAFRKKNLFYNLPEIKNNDIITVNWNGVDYNYKVTFKEEKEYVSRLSDLILITCKYYNSPVRIIVYAQRV